MHDVPKAAVRKGLTGPTASVSDLDVDGATGQAATSGPGFMHLLSEEGDHDPDNTYAPPNWS